MRDHVHHRASAPSSVWRYRHRSDASRLTAAARGLALAPTQVADARRQRCPAFRWSPLLVQQVSQQSYKDERSDCEQHPALRAPRFLHAAVGLFVGRWRRRKHRRDQPLPSAFVTVRPLTYDVLHLAHLEPACQALAVRRHANPLSRRTCSHALSQDVFAGSRLALRRSHVEISRRLRARKTSWLRAHHGTADLHVHPVD